MKNRFEYEKIPFSIFAKDPVTEKERMEDVHPAYRVLNLSPDWINIVVHRKDKQPIDTWYISDYVSGLGIRIPKATTRDEAVELALKVLHASSEQKYRSVIQRESRSRTEKNGRLLDPLPEK